MAAFRRGTPGHGAFGAFSSHVLFVTPGHSDTHSTTSTLATPRVLGVIKNIPRRRMEYPAMSCQCIGEPRCTLRLQTRLRSSFLCLLIYVRTCTDMSARHCASVSSSQEFIPHGLTMNKRYVPSAALPSAESIFQVAGHMFPSLVGFEECHMPEDSKASNLFCRGLLPSSENHTFVLRVHPKGRNRVKIYSNICLVLSWSSAAPVTVAGGRVEIGRRLL